MRSDIGSPLPSGVSWIAPSVAVPCTTAPEITVANGRVGHRAALGRRHGVAVVADRDDQPPPPPLPADV
jgi:hypothetical protein